jgi:hypothetical protein
VNDVPSMGACQSSLWVETFKDLSAGILICAVEKISKANLKGDLHLAKLEYRLLDETRGFPVLYHYNHIDKDEISMRFACDYLVKDGLVFEKASCAIEYPNYVIYLKPAEDEKVVDFSAHSIPGWGGIKMELREFREGTANYPTINIYEFGDDDDALLHLQSDFLFASNQEWQKTSTEIDEDRRVYVYYAKPTR